MDICPVRALVPLDSLAPWTALPLDSLGARGGHPSPWDATWDLGPSDATSQRESWRAGIPAPDMNHRNHRTGANARDRIGRRPFHNPQPPIRGWQSAPTPLLWRA